jgi:flagellar protein FlgJ
LNNPQVDLPSPQQNAPLSLHRGTERQRIQKASREFEAIMLQQLLKQAQPKMEEGLFGGGMGEKFFQDHLTQERARSMAANGGIGLAQMLEKELMANLNLKLPATPTDSVSTASQQRQAQHQYAKTNQHR